MVKHAGVTTPKSWWLTTILHPLWLGCSSAPWHFHSRGKAKGVDPSWGMPVLWHKEKSNGQTTWLLLKLLLRKGTCQFHLHFFSHRSHRTKPGVNRIRKSNPPHGWAPRITGRGGKQREQWVQSWKQTKTPRARDPSCLAEVAQMERVGDKTRNMPDAHNNQLQKFFSKEIKIEPLLTSSPQVRNFHFLLCS